MLKKGMSTILSSILGIAMMPGCFAEGTGGVAPKAYPTPQDVVVAYRQAVAKRDWRCCFLCLSPEARGATLREFCFVVGMGNSPRLVEIMEKHLKVKFFEDTVHYDASKDINDIFATAVKRINGRDITDDALLYDAFTKRVGDVSTLVEECCREYAVFRDFGEIKQIKVQGNKAVGYWTQPAPKRDPNVAGSPAGDFYEPHSFPISFRKINGGWFFADAPLSQ